MAKNRANLWAAQIADKSLMAICLLIGLVGVTASKAITVLVVLGGLAGIFNVFLNKRKPPQAVTAFTITLILLLVWAGVSALWSLSESSALNHSFRVAAICLAGYFLIHASEGISAGTREFLQKMLLAGYGLGLMAVAVGYAYAIKTGDSLWSSFYEDPLTTLNNSAVIVALLLWPATTILWRRAHPSAAIMLAAAVIGGLLFLSSGASLLSIAAGLMAFIIVLIFGRSGGLTIGAVVAGFVLLAPALTQTAPSYDTVKSMVPGAPSSVEHRLLMWDFVAAKIGEKSLLGWGMDSSRHLPQEAFRLAPNMEIMPLHPHDAALQIRLELGWPGALIAASLIFAVFRSIVTANKLGWQMAVEAGAAVAYLSVGAVSYGVWQSWWIATAWVLAAIVKITLPPINPAIHNRG